MSRYYSGDINGKFLFGVQDSTASERFGGIEMEPNFITYYFDEGDLKQIQEELEAIKSNLGDKFDLLSSLIENGFNDQILEDNGLTREDIKEMADYNLGLEIFNCVKETGQCEFDAEY